MVMQSALIRKIRMDVGQKRIEKSLKDIADKVKRELLSGGNSLHVMELHLNLGDYTPRKWWFQKLKSNNLKGVGREVYHALEKMGLNPTVGDVCNEFYNFYEIRIHF
jgi:hypothetical protein